MIHPGRTQTVTVTTPDPETLDQILDAERRRCQALVEVDLDVLDDLFDDSLVHIHAPGLTHSKTQLLEHVSTRQAYLRITRGDLTVRQVGDVAIVTGAIHNHMRSPDGGERDLGGVATQVLRRGSDGAWRFVSFQMTPAGEEVWPDLPSQQHDERSGA